MHNLDIVALFFTFLVTNVYCKNLSQSEVDHGNSSYSRKIKGASVAGRTMDVKSYETHCSRASNVSFDKKLYACCKISRVDAIHRRMKTPRYATIVKSSDVCT